MSVQAYTYINTEQFVTIIIPILKSSSKKLHICNQFWDNRYFLADSSFSSFLSFIPTFIRFQSLFPHSFQTYSDMDGFWRETSFEESVTMSSYLVCFIVFDFVQKNNTLANGKIVSAEYFLLPLKLLARAGESVTLFQRAGLLAFRLSDRPEA